MATRTANRTGEGDWRPTFAAAVWTATGLIAVLLISRRLGGHFTRGLPAGPTMLVVMLLTALNLLAAACLYSSIRVPSINRRPLTLRRALTFRRGSTDWAVALAIGVATLVPPFAVGLALLPAGSTAGLFALAALFLIAVVLMVLTGEVVRLPERPLASGRREPAGAHPEADASGSPRHVDPREPSEAADPPWLPAPDDIEAAARPTASHWMTRSTDPDGGETIEGGLTLRLPAGQKSAVFHVSFCPPLAGTPEVTCHLLDDRPLRLRVTTAQPYGTRIEAKRTGETSADVEATIAYLATTLPTTPAATAPVKAA